ncbi:MAG: hypothetical protein WAL22_14395 [Solirubrobacteraceae bacterium]
MEAHGLILRRGLLLIVVLAVVTGLVAALAGGEHARAEPRGGIRAAAKIRSAAPTVQAPSGVTCFVGVRDCGETPCVQFIGGVRVTRSDARPPCARIADAGPVTARIAPRPR